jgi:Icc-related predicted phosphoesterase
MKIVHISDTHGPKWHTRVTIPECDVLIHSGDIGGRTDIMELTEFLIWFEAQPAKKKIWVAGNHDLVLDANWARTRGDTVMQMLATQHHRDAIKLIDNYDVKYLMNKEYVYEGVKFWGSPYSPSFHREHWSFNADKGEEIKKIWAKIPTDVNVLITHTPAYGFLDMIPEHYLKYDGNQDGDRHRGCKDLLDVIVKRLFDLKLHCFGHIHDNCGVVLERVSMNRRVRFSNGAVMNDGGDLLVPNPLVITI